MKKTKLEYVICDPKNELVLLNTGHYGYGKYGVVYMYIFTNDITECENEAYRGSKKQMERVLNEIDPVNFLCHVPKGYDKVNVEDLEVRRIRIRYELI